MAKSEAGPASSRDLLADYSLEITTKDVAALTQARAAIPDGARVSITFLPGDTLEARVGTAAAVRSLGLVPVPHISARRLSSEAELEAFLDRLAGAASVTSAFVIAGDLERPDGPYEDALAVIASGALGRYGIRQVGVAGYPEGHPQISEARLWQALSEKNAALTDLGHEIEIVTQFCFDAAPVLDWLGRMRAAGIEAPARIGLPGPASVKTLLRFAARCGVSASAKVMSRYGLSMARLLNTAGPDALVDDLVRGLDPAVHGVVKTHFYPFGGIKNAVDWVLHAQHAAVA